MTAFIFTLALIAVCGFAAWRGGRDERIAAGAIALAALLSPFVALHRYAGPEVGLILVDLGLFIVLAGISLQSRAFWPMWAAGWLSAVSTMVLRRSRQASVLMMSCWPSTEFAFSPRRRLIICLEGA